MANKGVKDIKKTSYNKKGLIHQIKRVWKAFNIPPYEKGSYGKGSGKGYKEQMYGGAPSYKKVMKIRHKRK